MTKVKPSKLTKKVLSADKFDLEKDEINPDALYVIEKLQQNGFDGYIVGGGIRDMILAKTPKDFDIVTDATPEQVRKIFKRNSIIIGRRFKIVHIIFDNINPDKIIGNRPIVERHIIEVSTYRSKKVSKHSVSDLGKIMVDNNYGTQAEDASRRDFSINALFYDPFKAEIIDYHNGLTDIASRNLRMIGDPLERYIEDPVRVLRVIRLSIKLDLIIENKTKAAIAQVKHLLVNEHKGRLYEEMLKLLLSGQACKCIQAMKELPLPRNVFPLLDKVVFNNNPDQLALKIAAKTDDRLQQGSDVSTIFILSGLMWSMVYNSWQNLISDGADPQESLMQAIINIRAFAYNCGVTRYAYTCVSEVWLLQLQLENPIPKRIDHILASSRFRQAWHLYSTRHEIGQVDSKLHKWWDSFINTTDSEIRIELHHELNNIIDKSLKPIRILKFEENNNSLKRLTDNAKTKKPRNRRANRSRKD